MKMCEMWIYCEIQVWSREYTKRFHRGFKYQSFRGIITAIDVSVKLSQSFCLSVRNCCSLKLMSGYGFYVLTPLPWSSNIYYIIYFFFFFEKICQHWHKKKHSFLSIILSSTIEFLNIIVLLQSLWLADILLEWTNQKADFKCEFYRLSWHRLEPILNSLSIVVSSPWCQTLDGLRIFHLINKNTNM